MIKKIVTVVMCLCIVWLSYFSLQRKAETYDDCILSNIKNANTETAAKAVISSCREKFEVSISFEEATRIDNQYRLSQGK